MPPLLHAAEWWDDVLWPVCLLQLQECGRREIQQMEATVAKELLTSPGGRERIGKWLCLALEETTLAEEDVQALAVFYVRVGSVRHVSSTKYLEDLRMMYCSRRPLFTDKRGKRPRRNPIVKAEAKSSITPAPQTPSSIPPLTESDSDVPLALGPSPRKKRKSQSSQIMMSPELEDMDYEVGLPVFTALDWSCERDANAPTRYLTPENKNTSRTESFEEEEFEVEQPYSNVPHIKIENEEDVFVVKRRDSRGARTSASLDREMLAGSFESDERFRSQDSTLQFQGPGPKKKQKSRRSRQGSPTADSQKAQPVSMVEKLFAGSNSKSKRIRRPRPSKQASAPVPALSPRTRYSYDSASNPNGVNDFPKLEHLLNNGSTPSPSQYSTPSALYSSSRPLPLHSKLNSRKPKSKRCPEMGLEVRSATKKNSTQVIVPEDFRRRSDRTIKAVDYTIPPMESFESDPEVHSSSALPLTPPQRKRKLKKRVSQTADLDGEPLVDWPQLDVVPSPKIYPSSDMEISSPLSSPLSASSALPVAAMSSPASSFDIPLAPETSMKQSGKKWKQIVESEPLEEAIAQLAGIDICASGPILPTQKTKRNPSEWRSGTTPCAHLLADGFISTAYPRPLLPEPCAVWAATRQEVCETTDYFRSFQGGVYFKEELAKGYLLDGFGADRDICTPDLKVIVSHVGGKSTAFFPDTKGTPMKAIYRRPITGLGLQADQLESQNSARALLNNWRLQRPLVLVVGRNYSLFPWDLGDKAYVVLGWYFVSHVWSELEVTTDGEVTYKRIKVAFRRIPHQMSPFGTGTFPESSPASLLDDIYLSDDILKTSEALESTTESKMERRRRLMATPTPTIAQTRLCDGQDPRSPQHTPSSVFDRTFDNICGFCQKRSSLVYDCGWMCLYGSCPQLCKLVDGTTPDLRRLRYHPSFFSAREDLINFGGIYDIRPPPIEMTPQGNAHRSLRGMHCLTCGRLSCRVSLLGWKCANRSCGANSPIPREFLTIEKAPEPQRLHCMYIAQDGINTGKHILLRENNQVVVGTRFTLPDDCGTIWHLRVDPAMRTEAHGMFEAFQVLPHLERRSICVSRLATPLLGGSFSMNSGVPYHFVSEAQNVPLDQSPSCVVNAVDALNRLAQLVHSPDMGFSPFNEALSLCYLSGQKMNYHSDAEPGLGDTIASLSLGSPAYMDWRPYGPQWHGHRALRIELEHSDVIVMQGRKIQEVYQHRVIPQGLRVAITARQIYPEHATLGKISRRRGHPIAPTPSAPVIHIAT